MAKAILALLAAATVALGLAACKFESSNFIGDNNCSQTGGWYDAGRCSGYVAGP
jgi:hypothetical protein